MADDDNSQGGEGDIPLLRRSLEDVETRAKSLSWSERRPWKTTTHVWSEHDLPVIDLHDLNVRLARSAVRRLIDIAPRMSAGAICLITGRGRHSMGPPALRGMVASELRKACEAEPEWRQRPGHAGRWMLITDPARAPHIATGELGIWFWIGMVLFLALAFWAFLGL